MERHGSFLFSKCLFPQEILMKVVSFASIVLVKFNFISA